MTPDICLGAYATLEEAESAKALRSEPQDELTIREDGDVAHPFRIWWSRPV